MFRRKPLFPGRHFLETLNMQLQVLGTPAPDELAFIKSDKALEFVRALPPRAPTPWATLVPHASDEARSLLAALLKFDASKRATAAEALRHPYFDDIRARFGGADEENALVAAAQSLGPGAVDCAFDTDASLTATDLYGLVFAEIAACRRSSRGVQRGLVPALQAAPAAAGGVRSPCCGESKSSEDEFLC